MRGTHSLRSRLSRVVALGATSALLASTGWGSPAAAHITTDHIAARRHVVKRALSQIGTPYSYGSESPQSGFDCSGLTYWAFKGHGEILPRRSIDQWGLRSKKGYKNVRSRSNLRKGDLLFFKTGSAAVGHVGMYIGHRKMVHTGSSGGQVRIDRIGESYYKSRYVGAVRVPVLRK
ncbi:MAG: C40 family peptidase [Actinomycetota bacterium]|nr:C40 family peptidase [Actinomycetota bacterium]